MSPVLFCHITLGFGALLLGPLAFFSDKWGRVHRYSGRAFVWTMLGVYVTSTYISWSKELVFLFCIGQFSFFNVVTGFRAANFFRGQQIRWFDYGYSSLVLLVGAGMMYFAWKAKARGTVPEGVLFGVFGAACVAFSLQFMNRLQHWGRSDRRWIRQHIGGMIGGYTATVTAFVVTAIRPEPALLGWLGPSVVLPMVLSVVARRFRQRNPLG
jgi:uncharacterized membrane protein